jgi:hypothetical protein
MEKRTTTLALAIILLGNHLIALISGCSATKGEEDQLLQETALENLPPMLDGYRYKCRDMVRIVNHLRSLGKDEAIAVLKRMAIVKRQTPDSRVFLASESRVLLICRCLFQNPNGWEPPKLGSPEPDVSEDAVKKFPSFPIALSRGVPFFVIGGYSGDGRPEHPEACLKQCESLSLIASDLPTEGYGPAAKELVTSAVFRDLYPDTETRAAMANMIMKQTEDNRDVEQYKGRSRVEIEPKRTKN